MDKVWVVFLPPDVEAGITLAAVVANPNVAMKVLRGWASEDSFRTRTALEAQIQDLRPKSIKGRWAGILIQYREHVDGDLSVLQDVESDTDVISCFLALLSHPHVIYVTETHGIASPAASIASPVSASASEPTMTMQVNSSGVHAAATMATYNIASYLNVEKRMSPATPASSSSPASTPAAASAGTNEAAASAESTTSNKRPRLHESSALEETHAQLVSALDSTALITKDLVARVLQFCRLPFEQLGDLRYKLPALQRQLKDKGPDAVEMVKALDKEAQEQARAQHLPQDQQPIVFGTQQLQEIQRQGNGVTIAPDASATDVTFASFFSTLQQTEGTPWNTLEPNMPLSTASVLGPEAKRTMNFVVNVSNRTLGMATAVDLQHVRCNVRDCQSICKATKKRWPAQVFDLGRSQIGRVSRVMRHFERAHPDMSL
jgi:hypothetical protein